MRKTMAFRGALVVSIALPVAWQALSELPSLPCRQIDRGMKKRAMRAMRGTNIGRSRR